MPELPIPIPPLPTLHESVFMAIALLTVVGAFLVVAARNLFHNALGLALTFFGVAGVYFVAEAEFVGVAQILVYVGAISTLITFAIMLTRGMMFGATSPLNRQAGTAAIIADHRLCRVGRAVGRLALACGRRADHRRSGGDLESGRRLCHRICRCIPAVGRALVGGAGGRDCPGAGSQIESTAALVPAG
jgi:hypothetical protein